MDDEHLSRYLKEIRAWGLLTSDEEQALAQKIEAAEHAYRELSASTSPSPGRRSYLRDVVAEGALAREEFIESNLRLVVAIAKRYRASGLPILDLIQNGNIGLIKAVEKFDHRRGNRFSTHATWWIRQAIQNGMGDMHSTIRLPQRIRQTTVLVRMTEARLELLLKRHPTPDDIAAELHVPADRVREVLRTAPPVLSLHEAVDQSSSTPLIETLADETFPPAAESAVARLRSAQVRRLLSALTERERLVIWLRYGLDRGEPRTLREVGSHLNVTPERVRQIEREALRKLRAMDSARKLSSPLRQPVIASSV